MTSNRITAFSTWAKTQFLIFKHFRSTKTSSQNCSNVSKQIRKCPVDPSKLLPKWNLQRRRSHYGPFVVAGILGLGAGTSPQDNIFKQSLFPKVHCWYTTKKEIRLPVNLRIGETKEEKIRTANTNLREKLLAAKETAIGYTEASLKSYCDAIDAIQTYIDKVCCAAEDEILESPRLYEVWKDVSDALKEKRKLSSVAVTNSECAVQAWRKVQEIIDKGKKCELTCCNPLLQTTEETVKCGIGEICEKRQQFETLRAESKLSEKYATLVETYRKDLKAEVDSLAGGVEVSGANFTKNEADMLLTHAYKKILLLQKELRKLCGCGEGGKKKKCKKTKS